MCNDVAALVRLWREKRGEAELEDLSNDLVVQLGVATEDLNPTPARPSGASGCGSVLKWMAVDA